MPLPLPDVVKHNQEKTFCAGFLPLGWKQNSRLHGKHSALTGGSLWDGFLCYFTQSSDRTGGIVCEPLKKRQSVDLQLNGQITRGNKRLRASGKKPRQAA